MTTKDDISSGLDIAAANIPTVLGLLLAIVKLVNAGEDEAKQLDALQDAAETTKSRLDQLKFPEESKLP